MFIYIVADILGRKWRQGVVMERRIIMTNNMNWESMSSHKGVIPGRRYFIAADMGDGNYRPTTAVFLKKGDRMMREGGPNPLWPILQGKEVDLKEVSKGMDAAIIIAPEDGFYETAPDQEEPYILHTSSSSRWAEMPFPYDEEDERI